MGKVHPPPPSGYTYTQNDVIKCSKLATGPRRVVSLASFEHFMASFMVYIMQTMENFRRFVSYNNMEKVRVGLTLLSVEKVRALHLTSFLLSVLL